MLFTVLLFSSCTKTAQPQPGNNDTTTTDPPVDTSTYTVANVWECDIDGVHYSGTVDTSFMRIVFPYYTVDSVIVCTGTTADKKTQVHFKVALNRQTSPGGIDNEAGPPANTFLVFDTAADNLFIANVNLAPDRVNYTLDTLVGENIKISFGGTITDQKFTTHNISGKFSCRLNTGNNEPNKFYCELAGDHFKSDGYFTSAIFSANTINLIGIAYMGDPLYQFKLSIRTGGTIKPGTYSNRNGDVFFSAVPSGSITGDYYIDDTVGNVSVTIFSVEGNVVHGSFSGTGRLGDAIENGTFTCRIPNYQPQQDADTRWSFGAWVNPSFGDYSCYAGNTTSAVLSEVNGKHYLTVNGESDHGASVFKLVVSSLFDTIHPGYYYFIDTYDEFLDSFYFRSAVPTWDRKLTNLYIDRSVMGFGGTLTCVIDTLDDKHVTGILFGKLFGNTPADEIHKARFSARF